MGKMNLPLIVAVIVVVLLVGGIGAIIYFDSLKSGSPSPVTPTPAPNPTGLTAKTYDITITYSKPYQTQQWIARNQSDPNHTTEKVEVVALDLEFSGYTKNWTLQTEKFYVFNEHQPFARSPLLIGKTISVTPSSQGNVSTAKLYFDIPYQSNLVLGYSDPAVNALLVQKP